MPILEANGVTKYFGGLAAVTDVDMTVDHGEIVGLIGPNGAGKTTLFNLISGAIPATSGTIKFKNKKITRMPPHQICKLGIARTFQAVKLFTSLTVFENIYLAALYGNPKWAPSQQAKKEVESILDFVGLRGKENMLAGNLTVAGQKRLEIARALATKPELLLLDESIAGLNTAETSEAIEMIKSISRQGITIVMIEHIMKAIMTMCNRIIVLHYGKKIAEGRPDEIATNKIVIDIYLGE